MECRPCTHSRNTNAHPGIIQKETDDAIKMDERLAKAKKRKNKKKQVGRKEELATRARIAIMEDKMAINDKEEENMSDVPHHSKGGVAESRELTPSDDEHSDLTPPEDTPMATKVLPPARSLCSWLQPQPKIKISLMMKATKKAMVKPTTVNQPPAAPKPIPWPISKKIEEHSSK